MREDLPAAARHHPEWPIRLDHCFGRVILDAVCGCPWRETVAAPAWRNLPPDRLQAAVALADAILSGEADLVELNRRSLEHRSRRKANGSPCPPGGDLLAPARLQGTRPAGARKT